MDNNFDELFNPFSRLSRGNKERVLRLQLLVCASHDVTLPLGNLKAIYFSSVFSLNN